MAKASAYLISNRFLMHARGGVRNKKTVLYFRYSEFRLDTQYSMIRNPLYISFTYKFVFFFTIIAVLNEMTKT